MVDPQPTLVELLVRHVLLPREFLPQIEINSKEANLVTQTLAVEYRKEHAVLDELTQAYKNIEQVMRDQEDWVEVVYQLKQVICVRGG
jgi:RNA-splicing ligase RtcB